MDLGDLYRVLRTSHIQAQGVVDTIRDALLVLTPDLTVISANPAFYSTFQTSRDDTVGLLLYQLGNGQWDIEELRLLLEKVVPRSASVFDYEVTATFPAIGLRTMLVSAQRIDDFEKGNRVLLLTVVDASARRHGEKKKDVLIRELQHRMKNLLSVTHALARQTTTLGRTAEEYRDAFLGRFDALVKALEVSIAQEDCNLPDLARAILEPCFGEGRAVEVAREPDVLLSASEATAVGMILHELVTNAMKYGSLSKPNGRVQVDWDVEAGENRPSVVTLQWKETDGPAVVPPESTGFGTRLMQFAVERDLGGHAELRYEPEGFSAVLRFPRGLPIPGG